MSYAQRFGQKIDPHEMSPCSSTSQTPITVNGVVTCHNILSVQENNTDLSNGGTVLTLDFDPEFDVTCASNGDGTFECDVALGSNVTLLGAALDKTEQVSSTAYTDEAETWTAGPVIFQQDATIGDGTAADHEITFNGDTSAANDPVIRFDDSLNNLAIEESVIAFIASSGSFSTELRFYNAGEALVATVRTNNLTTDLELFTDNAARNVTLRAGGSSGDILLDCDGNVTHDPCRVQTLIIDSDTTGGDGCLMMRDTDDAGWTEIFVLDGGISGTIDPDGVCDGA